MAVNRDFGINGRFLTQPITGVQRYALNVTREIGEVASADGQAIPLLVPKSVTDPKIEGTPLHTIAGTNGHFWEQITLPITWHDRLLNLCNTAPALKADQVVCIHDANVFLAPNSYSIQFRILYKTLQPLVARRSARITTVSSYSAHQIAKYLSLNISDIVVLPNGHEHVYSWDPQQSTLAPSTLRRNSDGSKRPFVLALGSRARHKNLSLLVSIAGELASMGIDLVVAGGEVNIFTVEDLQRADNILHLGFVSDHDLAYLFKHALCLAFPSFAEGFGLPALEAMACGCVVVSTDRASLPEICGSAALLASPDQPQQWISHIRNLLGSTTLREDLIGRGHDQADKFSWSKTAQGYLDLMQSPQKRNNAIEPTQSTLLSVAVIIATLGRPNVVVQTLKRILERQSYKAAIVIVSCATPEDAGQAIGWPGITVVTGQPGLAAQRNTALSALPPGIDIVAFFDDDFVPDEKWLEKTVSLFSTHSDISCVTGEVLADGIKGPGMDFETVDKIIANHHFVTHSTLIEPFSPYGCNMAFRLSSIGDLRFDERLVLYGWLEDRDFGAALAAKGGRMVKCTAARGVHMGVKSGRIAGDRLGYSQIINPLYMLRKGTMTYAQVIDHILRNTISNLIGSIAPENFIDRRGRLRGNIRGIVDALSGRLEPERALKIRAKSVQTNTPQ